MGNSKNSKAHKKKKASKKCHTSNQKENIPKNQKNKVTKSKPDPNDSIAMSKQLMKKRTSVRSKRQTRNQSENRVCGNGKPIPSLADLEKMFEDSDEDDQSPNTSVKKTCTTPSPQNMSPVKEMPQSLSEKKLLSPRTINKISEKLLDMISNISNPIELLDDVTPPPIVPPKKRKKPDVPYIVGCKDRPQVIRKPNANFCKGDEDYGVQGSADPEEPPTKRAKKSRVPNYSKSIFNANSDEIAARLAKDEAGCLSDASSDSNKTIEYDLKPFRNQRPHRFSPLPSTSKDNETFIKNDELFNESLKNNVIEDETQIKKEVEVQIIDTPYETIVIDDVLSEPNPAKIHNTSEVNDLGISQIEKPIVSEDVIVDDDIEICGTNNDDDCVLVPSSTQITTNNNINQPIDIDDEYGNIDMENIPFEQEIIEVIDIDDVIAENKSILDKWKNNGEKLAKINSVVDVPNTYQNSSSSQTSVITPTINNNLDTRHENNEANSQSTPNNNSLPTPSNQININLTTDNCNNSNPVMGKRNSIDTIVTEFFQNTASRINKQTNSKSKSNRTNCMKSIFDAVFDMFRRVQAPAITPAQPATCFPPPSNHISTHYVNANNRSNGLTSIDLSQETRIVVPESFSSRASHSYGGSSSSFGRANDVATVQRGSTVDREPRATAIFNAPIQETLSSSPQNPEASRNLGECPICMDPLSGNGIASTICGHVFCLKCIQTAVKANGKRCPTCRKVLKGACGGYHQLYL